MSMTRSLVPDHQSMTKPGYIWRQEYLGLASRDSATQTVLTME